MTSFKSVSDSSVDSGQNKEIDAKCVASTSFLLSFWLCDGLVLFHHYFPVVLKRIYLSHSIGMSIPGGVE